jgi:hypothetical protein
MSIFRGSAFHLSSTPLVRFFLWLTCSAICYQTQQWVHTQTLKWRLHRCSRALVATGMIRCCGRYLYKWWNLLTISLGVTRFLFIAPGNVSDNICVVWCGTDYLYLAFITGYQYKFHSLKRYMIF